MNRRIVGAVALVLAFGVALAIFGGPFLGAARSPETAALAEVGARPDANAGSPGQEAYRFEVVAAESEALYRVREEFVNVALPVDAVGRTRQIQGHVVFDEAGTVIANLSSVRVNLASLQSDQARRDNFLRQNTLQTNQYPDAVLIPSEIRGLTFPLPAQGSVPVTIAGDMTIRNVTRRVEWTGTAHFDPQGMRIEATTAFTFQDFALQQPRVPFLLGVDETIRLEADVRFKRVDGQS